MHFNLNKSAIKLQPGEVWCSWAWGITFSLVSIYGREPVPRVLRLAPNLQNHFLESFFKYCPVVVLNLDYAEYS